MDGCGSRFLVPLALMLTGFAFSWLLVLRPEPAAAAAAGAPRSPPSLAGGHANSRETENSRWYQKPKRGQKTNDLPVGWLKELLEGRGAALGKHAAERHSTHATKEQTPTPSVSYHIQVLPESVFSVGMATFSSNVQRALKQPQMVVEHFHDEDATKITAFPSAGSQRSRSPSPEGLVESNEPSMQSPTLEEGEVQPPNLPGMKRQTVFYHDERFAPLWRPDAYERRNT
ncbi:hypothetical protein ENH_00043930, partial [Eimeria necatrix]